MTNEEFIHLHREEDVRRLALGGAPEGVDLRWCLQQIEGWQLARRKLPTWASTDGLWYPQRLSMEQCSSEETARYKRSIVERLMPEDRTSMTDLTGGLGVDFSQLAPLFREAIYVEILPELRQLAEHNMPLLGVEKERLKVANEEFLLHNEVTGQRPMPYAFQLIYLDPARRDGVGRKVAGIADCTPNLLDMQDQLLRQGQWVMVKLSPMLDITQALRELHGVREVHVVSLRGECKELLMVMKAGAEGPVTMHCVNLETDDDEIVTPYPLTASTLRSITPSPQHFLYEPNASILKAGISDLLTERYSLGKLHPRSNLFVGEAFIEHFPGRRFCIQGVSDFSKQGLRHLIGDLSKANLTVRNFPATVERLRRQLHLAEGGDAYLFATTIAPDRHMLLRCTRA